MRPLTQSLTLPSRGRPDAKKCKDEDEGEYEDEVWHVEVGYENGTFETLSVGALFNH